MPRRTRSPVPLFRPEKQNPDRPCKRPLTWDNPADHEELWDRSDENEKFEEEFPELGEVTKNLFEEEFNAMATPKEIAIERLAIYIEELSIKSDLRKGLTPKQAQENLNLNFQEQRATRRDFLTAPSAPSKVMQDQPKFSVPRNLNPVLDYAEVETTIILGKRKRF